MAPTMRAALGVAALLTLSAAGFIALYPAALTAWVSRWEANAALRAARLAEAQRWDAAEAALRRAAALPMQWTDQREGATRQRVYLGRHIRPAHRPFHRAALAFLAGGRHEAARLAAWEAIFRYHSVNRAGQSAELWRALSRACAALGETQVADLAALIADHAPLAPPEDAIAQVQDSIVTSRRDDAGRVQPIAIDAFIVWRNGRFNPANIVTTDSETLLFDHPCVVAAPLPESGAGADAQGTERRLAFSARGWSAYGWPPVLVFESEDGRWRRPWIVPDGQWSAGWLALPEGVSGRLVITYLNHGAEERGDGAEPVRRMAALRDLRVID